MQIFRFKLANYRYAFLLEMYSRQCWQMQWKLLLINFLETFRKVFYTKYVKKGGNLENFLKGIESTKKIKTTVEWSFYEHCTEEPFNSIDF